jgi:DNA-binding MarR family transcriptional regulator
MNTGASTPDQNHEPGTRGLGWTLGKVLRAWTEQVEAELGDFPHGARGYQVLAAVVNEDLPTQAALASFLSIDRTVMTYLLDKLEAAGLVARQPIPGDRRARRIVATEEGRRVLAEATRRVCDAERRVLGGLDDDACGTFQTLAERAALAIREAAPGTDPCIAIEDLMRQEPPQ